jgi:hypothetical protein
LNFRLLRADHSGRAASLCPRPTPNVGWFLEPTWTVNPRNGQQSFAASVGLLVGIP